MINPVFVLLGKTKPRFTFQNKSYIYSHKPTYHFLSDEFPFQLSQKSVPCPIRNQRTFGEVDLCRPKLISFEIKVVLGKIEPIGLGFRKTGRIYGFAKR